MSKVKFQNCSLPQADSSTVNIFYPYRWLQYSNFGQQIPGTQFLALKCPLKKVGSNLFTLFLLVLPWSAAQLRGHCVGRYNSNTMQISLHKSKSWGCLWLVWGFSLSRWDPIRLRAHPFPWIFSSVYRGPASTRAPKWYNII